MKIRLDTKTRPASHTQSTFDPAEVIALMRSSLVDHQVEQQTVNLLDHLAERLRIAESNQSVIVEMLGAIAADSSMSKKSMLATLEQISERLAEAPQVNLTVPVPEVNVTVEQPAPRRIEFERDTSGRIAAAEEVE